VLHRLNSAATLIQRTTTEGPRGQMARDPGAMDQLQNGTIDRPMIHV
jgi:hypothetical protein